MIFFTAAFLGVQFPGFHFDCFAWTGWPGEGPSFKVGIFFTAAFVEVQFPGFHFDCFAWTGWPGWGPSFKVGIFSLLDFWRSIFFWAQVGPKVPQKFLWGTFEELFWGWTGGIFFGPDHPEGIFLKNFLGWTGGIFFGPDHPEGTFLRSFWAWTGGIFSGQDHLGIFSGKQKKPRKTWPDFFYGSYFEV